MTLEDQVKVIQVELVMRRFTGIFDNEFTQEREWWLNGRCGATVARSDSLGTPGWITPNPDPRPDSETVTSLINILNRRT